MIDIFFKIIIDQGRLVGNIDWLQIDREYLEDGEGASFLSNLIKPNWLDQP